MDYNQQKTSELLSQKFGNKVRVRVCGLCLKEDSVLLANHREMGPEVLWLPPGGGLSFGEEAASALKREFQEETGLIVHQSEFVFVYEVLRPPFHAIELYFRITEWEGDLLRGEDPELGPQQQIIQEVAFVPFEQIKGWPESHTHHLFQRVNSIQELKALKGHFVFRY